MASTNENEGFVSLDGTKYEGGGGLVRDAISLSSILNKPVHIHSIRATRPGVGGLRPEHNVAIDLISDLTSAIVDGNIAASRELRYRPHVAAAPRTLPTNNIDVTVEGSASIFLIATLPYVLFSHLASKPYSFYPTFSDKTELELVIRAGTLCVKAPSIHYMQQVFVPTMEHIGITRDHFSLDEEYDQGWHTEKVKYPGKMVARIKPLVETMPGFVLHGRGELCTLQATAYVPGHAMESFSDTLRAEMADTLSEAGQSLKVLVNVYASVPDDQYHLLIVATTTHPVSYIGYEQVYPQRDIFPMKMERDTNEIATQLIRSCLHGIWTELRRGNAVDEHMEDILAIYGSLASGFSSFVATDKERLVPEFRVDSPALSSKYKLATGSMHRETSWWMIEQLTGVRLESRELNGCDYQGFQGIGLGEYTNTMPSVGV